MRRRVPSTLDLSRKHGGLAEQGDAPFANLDDGPLPPAGDVHPGRLGRETPGNGGLKRDHRRAEQEQREKPYWAGHGMFQARHRLGVCGEGLTGEGGYLVDELGRIPAPGHGMVRQGSVPAAKLEDAFPSRSTLHGKGETVQETNPESMGKTRRRTGKGHVIGDEQQPAAADHPLPHRRDLFG